MNSQDYKHRRPWVVVKIERGYVTRAKIVESFTKANRVAKRWQARMNPDYDEAAVVKAS